MSRSCGTLYGVLAVEEEVPARAIRDPFSDQSAWQRIEVESRVVALQANETACIWALTLFWVTTGVMSLHRTDNEDLGFDGHLLVDVVDRLLGSICALVTEPGFGAFDALSNSGVLVVLTHLELLFREPVSVDDNLERHNLVPIKEH